MINASKEINRLTALLLTMLNTYANKKNTSCRLS